MVPGEGTLMADLMARTGFVNAARALGLRQWDILPVERLLLDPPALLLADPMAVPHPALRRARLPVAPFDMRLLNCGGPTIIRAAAALAEARRRVP